MNHSSSNVRPYIFVWMALMALTAASCFMGHFSLGLLTIVMAPVLAAGQASLIAAFYMDALSGSKLIRVCIAGGVLWMFLMVSLTLVDYLTRGWVDPTGK